MRNTGGQINQESPLLQRCSELSPVLERSDEVAAIIEQMYCIVKPVFRDSLSAVIVPTHVGMRGHGLRTHNWAGGWVI